MSHSPLSLADWLQHAEALHGQAIELGLDRVQQVAVRLGIQFDVPVFTVAGTNGKGSTCALLEAILREAGYRVGVYTSPHLVHFEERCRLDGMPVPADALLAHFEAVEAARGDVSLTYFEFTTLAILRLLAQAGLDAVVLEVGLGGRLDAVNIVDADCAVITSIDLDHMEFLGADREAIGREKAGIMRAGRAAVIADPVPPASVLLHAASLGADLWLAGRDHRYAAQQGANGNWQQWSWSGRTRRYSGLAYPALRGANQLVNASGALAALEAMHARLPVTAQAVRLGLARVELPGRFQIVPGQPMLVLDVAHNPHAAATLARNLDQMGFYPRTLAVFGALADKDLDGLAAPLLPLVDAWFYCNLPSPRAASASELQARVDRLRQAAGGGGDPFAASVHADPVSALHAALEKADPVDRILVFGSFFTVGGVLEYGLPKLAAKHLNQGGSRPPGGP